MTTADGNNKQTLKRTLSFHLRSSSALLNMSVPTFSYLSTFLNLPGLLFCLESSLFTSLSAFPESLFQTHLSEDSLVSQDILHLFGSATLVLVSWVPQEAFGVMSMLCPTPACSVQSQNLYGKVGWAGIGRRVDICGHAALLVWEGRHHEPIQFR